MAKHEFTQKYETTDLEKLSMPELFGIANEGAVAYNALDDDTPVSVKAEVLSFIGNVCEAYNKASKDAMFVQLRATEHPLREAIMARDYRTIYAKATIDKELDAQVLEIAPGLREIDLRELHRKTKGGIGEDPEWIATVEALNRLLTMRANLNVGVPADEVAEINDTFAMRKLAADIDLGKTPTSNTQVTKLLNKVVLQMIGEGYHNATNEAANWVLMTMARGKREGHKNILVCPGHAQFTRIIAQVCDHCITGEPFHGESRACKKRK